ncbi:GntR family transcriptional regulator [Promicromonospora sp. AC04]|uniref:GntR family transcriptional regulator n=1 Tax=Promicromonospora sp. AC04 TaxID=2135723 RepID=UPI000D4E1231|nr:GntR family transcriptional regulator [Promicromonospora sp. AC04]PUB24849.1 GntR family transcriptional regulator [Promicromonospora sp. AC04]
MTSYLDRRHHRARLVRDVIRAKIIAGTWGRSLPAEDELEAQFGVGRNVVREALALLVHENLLRRIPGQGTQPTTHVLLHQLNSLRAIGEDGETNLTERLVFYRLIDWSELDPTPAVAEQLELEPGERVIRWERLTMGPEPLVLWSSFLRTDLGLRRPPVDSPSLGGGTFAYLESFGHELGEAVVTTGAARADAGVAELLRLEVGDPTMLQHRKTYRSDGTLVEIATGYYRSDQIHIVNHFQRRPFLDGRAGDGRASDGQASDGRR